jgi:hypothetical protein
MTTAKSGEWYNYIFHYNHYEELWYAIPRDQYLQYWNDPKATGIRMFTESNFKELLKKITK